MTKRISSLSGARESNAGDDFHVLWAIRCAVQMLNPSSGLTAIKMEDISPLEPGFGRRDTFLGVDVTGYYGGNRLSNSSRVVVSQLKYSTRHPDTNWTAARLCAERSTGEASVIIRLADVYLGFLSEHPREEVLKKLEIKLVSNQPVAPNLEMALAEVKVALELKSSTATWRTADLVKCLSSSAQNVLERLRRADRWKALEHAVLRFSPHVRPERVRSGVPSASAPEADRVYWGIGDARPLIGPCGACMT